jgi:aryl-alcohol dehydrogenase-like predicted oxidoreductase
MSHESSNRVEEISRKRGISMAQVSLAWSLTRVTAPVVGSTSMKNLEELLSACNYYIFRIETNP